MIYSQYDDGGLYEIDSLDRGLGDAELDRVFEKNDFSYVMDLDDIG